MNRKGGCGAVGFLLTFGLFWTAITGVFDVFIGYTLWRQVRAESWPTVSGVVTKSEVESHSDSDGTTYSAEISFRYQVNGQANESDTWRFGAGSSSDSSEARGVVRRYPVGQPVTVHYDPNDPSSAVLEVGVQGSDLFLLLFMTPFNVVMLGIWFFGAASLLPKGSRPRIGGAAVDETPEEVRIHLARMPPVAVGGITAGGVSFFSIFIVGFGFGFSPPMPVVLGTWGVVLGLAVAAGFIQFYRNRAGIADLVLDGRNRMVSLPTTRLFGNGPLVPMERFTHTGIQRVVTRHENSTSIRHKLLLHYHDEAGAETSASLCTWTDEADVRALADWLNERLSITTRREDAGAPASADGRMEEEESPYA